MSFSIRQAVEFFHLCFLKNLVVSVDPLLIAVKGGCNLRFFFSSIRYSEDLDLDVKTIAVKTLEKNVDKVLNSQALRKQLKSFQIEIAQSSKPKQTATTQRWKVQLFNAKLKIKIPTKIEFSRRSLSAGVKRDLINQAMLDEYHLPRFFVPHYNTEQAFEQKVRALIGRQDPQVRDVFDLDLLLSHRPQRLSLAAKEKELIEHTIFSLSYTDYLSQVVAYLFPEEQSLYMPEQIWSEIQLRVLGALLEVS